MDNTMGAYMDVQRSETSGVVNSTPDSFNGVYGENMSVQTASDKPYTFRRLKSRDVFPMVRLIRKIGVSKDEVSKLLDEDLMSKITGKNKPEQTPTGEQGTTPDAEQDKDSETTAIGIQLVLNIADLVMERLPACEDDIYTFLASVSNLDAETIKDLDMNVFVMMIVDFFKKDEFRDFFKAVSALMK